MKHTHIAIWFFYFVLFINNRVLAQSYSYYRYADTVISYDYISKRIDKPIPFDVSFNLKVVNDTFNDVQRVFLYSMTNRRGKREIKYIDTSDNFNRDYVFQHPGLNNGQLVLKIQPLKPQSNFDLLIVDKLSDDNLNLLNEINTQLWVSRHTPPLYFFPLLIASRSYNKFLDKTCTNPYLPNTYVTNYRTLYSYDHIIFSRLYPIYNSVHSNSIFFYNNANYPEYRNGADTLVHGTIFDLFSSYVSFDTLKKYNISGDKIAFLYPFSTQRFGNIMTGELSPYENDLVDIFNFPKRLKNIDTSINLLSTIKNMLQSIISFTNGQQRDRAAEFLSIIDFDINVLKRNKSVLNEKYNEIKRITYENIFQSTWLLGSTTVPTDLQTVSGNFLSTELGITNILVNDLQSHVQNFPRIFIGLDINFSSINKNTFVRSLPDRCSLDTDDHLSSYRTFFRHHISLLLGLTFGSIPNSSFDNLYNSFSFIVGPSYRFERVLRISGGAALLKRQNPNPLFNQKKAVVGEYLSFSVDLGFIKNQATDFVNYLMK